MLFEDRADAGRRLGEALAKYKGEEVVVLALPRGGVPVAAEVAKALHAPLDLIVARKIGHPDHPEYGIGAVTDDGYEIFNEGERQNVDPEWLKEEIQSQIKEAQRRREAYLGGRQSQSLMGKTAILIDDGIATGYTLRAAIHSARARQAKHIVVASPVAPRGTDLPEADDVVVLETPEDFRAIGSFYRDFEQTGDTQVKELLENRL